MYSVDNQTQEIARNAVINELQLGSNINSAVEQNRRADFALLVAMFSEDTRETEPVEKTEAPAVGEELLRGEFRVPDAQALRATEDSYTKGAEIARQFHEGGINSAKLQNGLSPDALSYFAQNTHGLGEEVFHNLSFHSKRALDKKETPALTTNNLYQSLIHEKRGSEISQQV